MKVKLVFELSRPDAVKDALRIAMAKLVCNGNNNFFQIAHPKICFFVSHSHKISWCKKGEAKEN